jgi:hypothetical protein
MCALSGHFYNLNTSKENSIAGSKKPEIKDEDLRSLRSEFDYTHKKKFTDVLTESQRG